MTFVTSSVRPSAMMFPQDGVMVDGTPAPMKERIDSTIMALAQQATGKAGHYGSVDAADGVMPSTGSD